MANRKTSLLLYLTLRHKLCSLVFRIFDKGRRIMVK
uniref:Uncharacterized protein n=1 Tax=Rhizophora mucronata TaxID=61149 RepID=A0A2P2IW57_RHIMU